MKRFTIVAASAALALLTACGGTATAASHNRADVTFATDMIPHHAQALEMADMALTSATDTRVKALAADIRKDQDPEITRMTGWLTGWGEPVPTGSAMSGMDHGAATGMMTGAEMSALGKATGAAFDRQWVLLMTRHHQGAVAMAQTEIAGGRSDDARTLARSIVTSQTAQIDRLRALATTLPA